MSTEREDGPVKHYRYVCDKCGKQSKRGAYEPGPLPEGWVEYNPDEENYPPGWKEGDGYDPTHYCISDHDACYRPLVRLEKNKLVIDLQDGQKLIFTSNTAIKVEMLNDDEPEPEPELAPAMPKGDKIFAIAVYRNLSGCGLKEGKDYVEAHGFTEDSRPITPDFTATEIQNAYNITLRRLTGRLK